MERFLITNADDVGWNSDINDAACLVVKRGTLTSFSVMANGAAVSGAAKVAMESKNISVGVHLNISTGFPVAEQTRNTLLVNSAGEFRGSARYSSRYLISSSESKAIKREFLAQIRVIQDLGVAVSHLDTHHHVARVPAIWQAMVECAQEVGVHWVRSPRSHRGMTLREAPKILVENRYVAMAARRGIATPMVRFGCPIISDESELRELFKKMVRSRLWREGDVAELSFHPSLGEGVLGEARNMGQRRASDLRVLADMKFRDTLSEFGVVLCPYQK